MKRVVTAELLDTDSGSPSEIADSLDDLRMINRWFGGISTSEDLILRVARKIHSSSLSLLEVAAGSGYVPETAREQLQASRIGTTGHAAGPRGVAFGPHQSHFPKSHLNGGDASGYWRCARASFW